MSLKGKYLTFTQGLTNALSVCIYYYCYIIIVLLFYSVFVSALPIRNGPGADVTDVYY